MIEKDSFDIWKNKFIFSEYVNLFDSDINFIF